MNPSPSPTAPADAVVKINLEGRSFHDVQQEVERLYFGHVLTRADGNKTRAAALAGIACDTFRKRLKLFNIAAVFHVS